MWLVKNKVMNLSELEKNIGYTFKNKSHLKTALTHSSYLNEVKNSSHSMCNERMEFLGDSVLGMFIAKYLFLECNNLSEGKMSKLRANVVCESSLAQIAGEWNLGKFLFLSIGEEKNGGRTRNSILSDAVESIIAGVFLDGGADEAENLILKFFKPHLESAINGNALEKDYKSVLQEYAQSNGMTVRYDVLSEKGPDHLKSFEAAVLINDKIVAKGEGASKKIAEQKAAGDYLSKIKTKD